MYRTLANDTILSYTDTIMAHRKTTSRLKTARTARNWSQAELAQRAGISRAAVSAIEGGRLVPSVAAALALAKTLRCSVEELFGELDAEAEPPQWAWRPKRETCRYWQARVGERSLLFPVEPTLSGMPPHDGVYSRAALRPLDDPEDRETLMLACCDPAAGLLAARYARTTPFRMIVLPRSSGEALRLLGAGLVHVAGVHLSAADESGGNAAVVRRQLGDGYHLLRVVRWEEGLAVAPRANARSVRSVLRSRLSWVGRDVGSGARQCLDELLAHRRSPRRIAYDHRGVAEAVRCGWADVGVCLQLVSEEAGLKFLSVRRESYDLCYAGSAEADPRIRALVKVVQSSAYRRLVEDLPGYDAAEMGEIHRI